MFTHDDIRAMSKSERLAHALTIELPYSEVCMHMRVAGTTHPVIPCANHMAQILEPNGSLFSFPVTRGEAGITDQQYVVWASSSILPTRDELAPVRDRFGMDR